jgi:hypothetical protein
MIQTLQRALFVLVVINGWLLLGIIVFDYLFGNFFGLFPTSIHSQAWVILLLMLLSSLPALKATHLDIKQWCITSAAGISVVESIGQYQTSVARFLRALYINLYLLADVVFCVGAPLLILSATVGWWLLDEVSYLSLLGYCCMISVIVFSGLYSNLVRLLSLGYFFGYWLLSENMLLYPFVAPGLVQQNIGIMLEGSVSNWLPVIGLVLIVLLLTGRRKAMGAERTSSRGSAGFREILREIFLVVPKAFNRELFGNYLSLFCLFMAVPLAVFLLNGIIGFLNPHVLFGGFAIWIFDRLWQADVDHEPALSTDFRYFVNLIWRH